jgi:Na+:H+ antiporter, NhaA family
MAQCTAALSGLGRGKGHEGDRRQQAAAQTLEVIAERIQSPLQRLERSLNPWVAYLIVPVFALVNAGVEMRGNLADALTNPISLGIIAGLALGKPLGITLFAWLAVRLGLANLPDNVTWARLFSASWLAGIGFTMSLFIASSAFAGDELDLAKMSILVASLLAAAVGVGLLFLTSARQERVTALDAAEATS